MAQRQGEFDKLRRRTQRSLAPGQSTFVRYAGATWLVYRPYPPRQERFAR